ncbi:response regulator transcription factor [Clostridium sp. SHJSY1]|uniref:response regulator transcription factor n=1 Tax=Clostridium sp. SHJSY1 TaxID=2942483 RepID=UPI0028753C5C|nr:response regulator transcription factor [Clostridium sp. SHJSY1]MDS0525890.1 response regulator transcription factor [Clostridium sp. SHJSY1]
MKSKVIRILIADDQDIIRQGLKRIIGFEEDMEIVVEAANGKDALKLLNENELDIALLDCNMPIMNGIEVLANIKENGDKIKVIMFTIEDDIKTINKAINIGADGYMLKDSVGTEIANAVRLVHNGEKYIDKSLVSLLFSGIKIKPKKESNLLELLSKREVEVLIKISKGLSNKEIGEQLYLSEKTVRNYATNLFRKIDVEDRVHATIFAIENNIDEYYINKY